MSDIVRVVIVGKNVREAEGYWRAHHGDEYAGKSVKVMSVELAGNGNLLGYGRGTRVDILPGAGHHKKWPAVHQQLRLLQQAGRVEVRWCPSGSR